MLYKKSKIKIYENNNENNKKKIKNTENIIIK